MAGRKIVIGNWKMNPESPREAEKLFAGVLKFLSNVKKTEVVICPPFLYLGKLKKLSRKVYLGAQNAFYADSGAFTGEISPAMLYNLGARYVILGHSERRARGENNKDINKKIKASLWAGLKVVLCLGEEKRDENHEYLNFVKTQAEECLEGISKNFISKIIVAYEPVWAIGAGARPAIPEEFYEMNIFIRKILSDKFGVREIQGARIIYGGSVNPKNAPAFLKDGQAGGFLVGRDSLDSKKFGEIIKICETSSN